MDIGYSVYSTVDEVASCFKGAYEPFGFNVIAEHWFICRRTIADEFRDFPDAQDDLPHLDGGAEKWCEWASEIFGRTYTADTRHSLRGPRGGKYESKE